MAHSGDVTPPPGSAPPSVTHFPAGTDIVAKQPVGRRTTATRRPPGAGRVPIAPRATRRSPALAWFARDAGDPCSDRFARLLDRTLLSLAAATPAQVHGDELRTLMARARTLCAFDSIDKACGSVPERLGRGLPTRVLLIDERVSVPGAAWRGRQRVTAFRRLVARALAAHPVAEFWIARSAGDGSGRWLSECFAGRLPEPLRFADDRTTVCQMIESADHVYTVSAPEGMHALLADVPLHVQGTPYYAGWGLTHDAYPRPERRSRPSVAMLFYAVFCRLASYRDPSSRARGNLGALLDCIALQRSVQQRYAAIPNVVGIRFQLWKRRFATPFLGAGGRSLRWTDDPAAVSSEECAALWGARDAHALPAKARYVRIEDGFLHSTGLGSDLSAPLSQVVDTLGIYFDPTRPSDLNRLLNRATFDEAELARAAALRARIVAEGLTKYNLGRRRPDWQLPAGRTVVLVPGQVADDASVRLGTRGISTAEALLEAVRVARPDAWIIYKPHPDVLSGNRRGLVYAARHADRVDTTCDLISLIEIADEVHTLSSLAGFEALLRGKKVRTYGMPFYAGWGLTDDVLPSLPSRERTLTLDMLTAGVLLRYPLYWDWRLMLFTTPEHVVDLLAEHAGRPLRSVAGDRLRLARKAWRWMRNLCAYVIWRRQARSSTRRDRPNQISASNDLSF